MIEKCISCVHCTPSINRKNGDYGCDDIDCTKGRGYPCFVMRLGIFDACRDCANCTEPNGVESDKNYGCVDGTCNVYDGFTSYKKKEGKPMAIKPKKTYCLTCELNNEGFEGVFGCHRFCGSIDMRNSVLSARNLKPKETAFNKPTIESIVGDENDGAADKQMHYINSSLQPIEQMQRIFSKEMFCGFLLGNALKYRERMGTKPGEAMGKDETKARQYLYWYTLVLGGAMINPVKDTVPDSFKATNIFEVVKL